MDTRDRQAHRPASFTALGWVPLPDPNIRAEMVDFGIDYTFWLNIVFGALAAYYVYVNLRNPMHHHGAGHDHAAHERHHGHDHHAHAVSKQGGGAQHDGHAGHHDYSDTRG